MKSFKLISSYIKIANVRTDRFFYYVPTTDGASITVMCLGNERFICGNGWNRQQSCWLPVPLRDVHIRGTNVSEIVSTRKYGLP